MESIPAMDISPIVFLSENELKQEEKEEIENVVIDMNDISVKDNDYLLVGIFGNGTGYLKATFSEEMKGKGAYKAKFMYQGKDKMKKKVISAELYQIETNAKKVLILLTKSGYIEDNDDYLIEYFEKNKISYKEIIIFDSIYSKNYFSIKDIKNKTFCIKSRKCSLSTSAEPLSQPNSIGSFAASLMNYADYHDMSCLILISVIDYYDICYDSTKVYNASVSSIDILKGKNENFSSDKNFLFNEFNAIKNSYFS